MAVLLRHHDAADGVHPGGRNLDVNARQLISGMYVELLRVAALNRVAVIDREDRSRGSEDNVGAVSQAGKTKLSAIVCLRKAGEVLRRAACTLWPAFRRRAE